MSTQVIKIPPKRIAPNHFHNCLQQLKSFHYLKKTKTKQNTKTANYTTSATSNPKKLSTLVAPPLPKRMQQHAYEAKANHFKKPLYKFMKLHNTEIILYKLYPCNNRRELLYAEGQYIKKLIKQGHKLANKVMSPDIVLLNLNPFLKLKKQNLKHKNN